MAARLICPAAAIRAGAELERRIVLSQYLTAIQCAGRTPPQETGLTFNSWEGKFHLEMHWWHAAHFALWNRLPLLEKSLDFYRSILPRARGTAARQGYTGARWPKMTDPSGAESPSSVGPFLVWQQPHPIFYAELAYRAKPTRETLERFREVVFDTAEFMAILPGVGRYHRALRARPAAAVCPGNLPEEHDRQLHVRAGLLALGSGDGADLAAAPGPAARGSIGIVVLEGPAPLPVADGKYLFAESTPDCYKNPRWARDHPSVTGALGILPGPGIDARRCGARWTGSGRTGTGRTRGGGIIRCWR